MKKLFPLIFMAILGYGAYVFLTSGGSVSGPTEKPNLPPPPDVPDANEGAQAAEDGANWLGDQVAGFGPQVWRLIILGCAVGAIVWMWKDPRRRSIALGVALIAALVFAVSMK